MAMVTVVRFLWTALAAGVLLGVAVAPGGSRAEAAAVLDPEEQAAFDLLNQERTSRGLAALTPSATLQAVAEWMATDMTRNSVANIMTHTDTLGRDVRARFNALGYTPNSAIAENLNAGQRSARESIQAWMDSPTHRANNLAPDMRAAGLALVVQPGTPYVYYWTLTLGSVDESVPAPTPGAPSSAAAVVVNGSVPSTGVAILQTGGAGTPEGVVAGLAQRGCTAASIWLITGGSLTGYLAGAPSFVNAAFPASIAAGAPFIAVCR